MSVAAHTPRGGPLPKMPLQPPKALVTAGTPPVLAQAPGAASTPRALRAHGVTSLKLLVWPFPTKPEEKSMHSAALHIRQEVALRPRAG